MKHMNMKHLYSIVGVGVYLISGMLMGTEIAVSAPADADQATLYEWAVVGAGPGGIIAMGVLRDVGFTDSNHILWVDRDFSVGSMGKYYAQVPANNKAKRLVEFFTMCNAFRAVESPALERLKQLDPMREYPLRYLIDPLQEITDAFLTQCRGVRGQLQSLMFEDDSWILSVDGASYRAKRVILAIGSHPRNLGYAVEDEIPLEVALNEPLLANRVTKQDTVAVVGGSHSAVLVLKYLCDIGAGRIINFYQRPLWYLSPEAQAARECVDIVGDPLSGIAAEWAREVLDKNPPAHLIRIKSSSDALKAWLPICTKIVYAAGFEHNELPAIAGITIGPYDARTGVIGKHLFGIGLAFPEFIEKTDGTCKYAIGVKEFMMTAQRLIPEWISKNQVSSEAYALYDDLILFVKL